MARVSIGIPVYNAERYLAEALDSLLCQTFQDLELVICDNCSTDSTREIAEEYAGRDDRLAYHRNDANIGASANFNRVIELTSCEYFKWAAHDDLCGPTFVERCVELLDEQPDAVLAYPRAHIIGPNAEKLEAYELRLATDADDAVTRFRALLRGHKCFEVFGLIRRAKLLETPPDGKLQSR